MTNLTAFEALAPYNQLAGPRDRLKMMRELLSYPLINWVSQYFSRTRDAETKLFFVDYCRRIIEENEAELSEEELEFFDKVLISYELGAYDQLNLWQEYVDFFNLIRRSKRYVRIISTRNELLSGIDEYLLWQDGNHKHVHFLFSFRQRYEIIQRKLARLEAGKSTAHLERHGRERLTEDEKAARFGEMVRLFAFIRDQRTQATPN